MKRFLISPMALVLLALAVPSVTWADPDPPVDKPAKSLDDQLLEDLDGDLIDGDLIDDDLIDDLSDDLEDDADNDKALADDLGGGADVGGDDDPLSGIGRKMRTVSKKLVGRDSAQQTQKLQKDIVDRLNELIEQIKNNSRKSGSSGSKSGAKKKQSANKRSTPKIAGRKSGSAPAGGRTASKPAQDSEDRVGRSKAKVDMQAMEKLMKDLWGHLPEKTREEMLQAASVQFLPKYELKLEKYFKRLAEKKAEEQ